MAVKEYSGADLNTISRFNGVSNVLGKINGVDVSPASFLLDTYTGAAAAYSVRLLRTAYTGDIMRVRRASDSVEADVGFDSNNELSLTSPISNTSDAQSYTDLADFVDHTGTPTDAYVRTWYDQAGSNDASQSTAANQGQIYDASTGLITQNGKPALTQGTGNMQYSIPLNLTQPNSIFCVVDLQGTVFKTITRGQNLLGQWYGQNNSPTAYGMYAGSWLTATPASGQVLDSLLFNGSSSVMFQNGSSFLSGDPGSNDMSDNSIGETSITGNFEGKLQELIFYDNDQLTSNRTGIEGNLNSYFNVF